VILLTDLNSRIPVTVAPGNIQAIMAGDNSPMPSLDMVSHTVALHAGDQVTSSGDGGLLPAVFPSAPWSPMARVASVCRFFPMPPPPGRRNPELLQTA